ncbi:MAG: hypothetical protein JO291_09235 [Acidimicrobiia bacterium]|nr:hypothetical protein [Acidimicrobiia bacterium]
MASDGTKSLAVYSKHSVNDRDHVWAVLMNADGGAPSNPIRIDSHATNAYEPHVAWNGTSFLVVWTHDFNDRGTDLDIRGQLVTASGALIGGEIPIETSAAKSQYPAVAAGPDGTFEVAYNDSTTSATTANLRVVPLSAGGTVGSKTTLRTGIGFAANDLVWVSAAQRFVVTYASSGRAFAVFTAAGAFQGGQVISDYESTFPDWPSPTALATDGSRVLAVFPTFGQVSATWIDLQPISRSDPFTLPSSSVSGLPDVAFNGVFLVVWAEETQTVPKPEKWALKAARLKSNGTQLDTTSSLITDNPNLNLIPALSRGTSTAGSFTLAWQNGNPGDQAIVFTAGVKASTK